MSASHLVYPEKLNQELQESNAPQGEIILVDVREPEEFERGYLKGAKLIPLDEITSRAEKELPKGANLVVYCAHGYRSLEGVLALKMLGFENCRSLVGGLAAWHEQHFPIET